MPGHCKISNPTLILHEGVILGDIYSTTWYHLPQYPSFSTHQPEAFPSHTVNLYGDTKLYLYQRKHLFLSYTKIT